MAVSHRTPVVAPHLQVGHTGSVIGIVTTASAGFFRTVAAYFPKPPRPPAPRSASIAHNPPCGGIAASPPGERPMADMCPENLPVHTGPPNVRHGLNVRGEDREAETLLSVTRRACALSAGRAVSRGAVVHPQRGVEPFHRSADGESSGADDCRVTGCGGPQGRPAPYLAWPGVDVRRLGPDAQEPLDGPQCLKFAPPLNPLRHH